MSVWMKPERSIEYLDHMHRKCIECKGANKPILEKMLHLVDTIKRVCVHRLTTKSMVTLTYMCAVDVLQSGKQLLMYQKTS